MEFSIDRDFIKDILVHFVQTDSRNPAMVEDGPGEVIIGEDIARILKELGLQVKIYPLAPGRVNVVGVLPGKGGGRSLILNGHMDTVGVDEMPEPFSGEIREGRLYGRGSQDMKGSLAAMLGAIKALVDDGISLEGDLIFTAVADEENQSLGTIELIQEIRADGAIVTEPTDLKVVAAHRGWIWYEVEVEGRAAHGSRYQDGRDAILMMGRFLVELESYSQELIKRPGHPLTGPPSVHTSLIEGGSDMCTYPPRCKVSIERRTVEGETEIGIREEIQVMLDRLREQDQDFKACLRLVAQRAPLNTSPDSGVIEALIKAYSKVMDSPPEISGAAYWTDAALLSEKGVEAVLIGPVGAGLHSAEEWVDLNSVYDLAEILAATAVLYCGL
ncbi:MAG TPA: ArgE/DapE family deacylase [Chloroflexi bacterium]|nr:MAG: acetylornithine deacetylase [Chloroflexota bacterium]HDD55592.1 ArgE/DapE family deacylase [Chloroflexota bacterium]